MSRPGMPGRISSTTSAWSSTSRTSTPTGAIFTRHRSRSSAATASKQAGSRTASGLRRGGLSPVEHLADPVDDPFAVWEHVIFEDGAIGDRYLQGAHPPHRGLEPREGRCILRGDGSDLRREPGSGSRLVRDDEPAGFLYRVADRLPVQ